MRVAAIDLGTNTFLCLIAEITEGRVSKVVADETELVRLGQSVDKTRRFHPEALERAQACLKRFSELIKSHQVDRVRAVATSAARDALPGENDQSEGPGPTRRTAHLSSPRQENELLQICQRLNIPVEVISGDREAELTFQGATSELPEATGTAVIDVGGGSTEIVLRRRSGDLLGRSLDIGSVRLTEKFLSRASPKVGDLEAMEKYIRDQLNSFEVPFSEIQRVIAVAGTPTTIAAIEQGIEFQRDKIDAFVLTTDVLNKWVRVFAETRPREIAEQYRIEEKRADVILAGTMILNCALKYLRQRILTVSIRGVRYGLAVDIANRG